MINAKELQILIFHCKTSLYYNTFNKPIDNLKHTLLSHIAIKAILLYLCRFDIFEILFFIYTKFFEIFLDDKSISANLLSLCHKKNLHDNTIILKSLQFEKAQGKA